MKIFQATKFENEIKEPPPNAQEDFSLATDDENPQEHWQQEQLVEEMNLEKNDEQDCHYMKEESFQDIVDESRTLEVVGDKEKDESIVKIGNLRKRYGEPYSSIFRSCWAKAR
jgi:hypothetical protein